MTTPETCRKRAHRTTKKGRPALRARILLHLRKIGARGSTCYEAAKYLGASYSSVTSCVNAMKANGEIVARGARPTNTSCLAVVYVLPEHAWKPGGST